MEETAWEISMRLLRVWPGVISAAKLTSLAKIEGIFLAIPSYQRRPSSLRKREGNVRFPTNLHGVRRSPTSM